MISVCGLVAAALLLAALAISYLGFSTFRCSRCHDAVEHVYVLRVVWFCVCVSIRVLLCVSVMSSRRTRVGGFASVALRCVECGLFRLCDLDFGLF